MKPKIDLAKLHNIWNAYSEKLKLFFSLAYLMSMHEFPFLEEFSQF